jgi:hypothetical protein
VLQAAACDAVHLAGSPRVLYLVPENFSGWVCVDFDIKGAPPLPREGQHVVIRAKSGTILQTSEPDDVVSFVLPMEAWVEGGGTRRRLPADRAGQRTVARSGPNEPTQRNCRFIGTTDQQAAVRDAPGFEGAFRDNGPIAAAERAALVALFEATGGPAWTHRVGWLGPPGTECRWHGVDCGPPDDAQSFGVIRLDLMNNNLRGVLPEALAGLNHLKSFDLHGNQLTGRFPDSLMRRWDSGELTISAPASSFTDVSEIRLETSSVGYTRAWRRIILGVDGRATMFTERERARWFLDFATYCEVKQGQVFGDDFARLARVVDRSGYYALQPEYQRLVTHATLEVASVTRNGKTHDVSDYASAGPLALWAVRQAIAGLAGEVRWESVASQPGCPAPFTR